MQPQSFVKIFSGTSTKYLAENISKSFGQQLGTVEKIEFSDGEYTVKFDETLRGSHVFLIQSTFPPADNLFELLMMIDAAKRASASSIIAVLPYFGYARQDRKDQPRVAIGAKLVADLLTAAGVNRIITMDLHADQIQGFFNIPVDHLYSSTIFVPYIKKLKLNDMVVASPDAGGSKRADSYAKYFGAPMVICHKYRPRPNVVGEMRVIGDVKGKNVILLDDMIDTAGTLTAAADKMMEQGALSVRAFASHGVLSGDAYEKIENSSIEEVVITDSIPLKRQSPKIKVLSVADMFAETIACVYNNETIAKHFVFRK
ncbi:MAG: ribose-phosphate pyrophosphokinase [Bacteroidales bacterium]|nr:ribose-phosphate pyrophosphokinase [Bacteroidales bacterium]